MMVYVSVSPTVAMGWSTVLVVPIWGRTWVDVGVGVGVFVGGTGVFVGETGVFVGDGGVGQPSTWDKA